MNCEVCLEPFDNTLHEPYKLKLCSHNLCVGCLAKNIFAINKCPQCGILINGEFFSIYDEFEDLGEIKTLVNININIYFILHCYYLLFIIIVR